MRWGEGVAALGTPVPLDMPSRLVEHEDAPASTATPYTLQPGETFRGTISVGEGDTNSGDGDWVRVVLVQGQDYRFVLQGEGVANTTLRLMDATGQTVSQQDPVLSRSFARDGVTVHERGIETTAVASGAHYLWVTGGNNHAYTLSVTEVNVDASISGDTTGAVTEDDPARQEASGALTVTDPDPGEARFRAPEPEALQGTYGSFIFNPLTGAWRYVLANDSDAVQSLPEGAEVTDSLTVTSFDGTASETITVTVTGVNDPASIVGDTTGAVAADDPDRQLAAGVLTVTDPDTGEARFAAPEAAALQGAFGSFAFDAGSGAWSYLVDGAAAAALAPGATAVERLTVTSLDGTASETIEITVTGPDMDGAQVVTLSGLVLDRAGNELAGTTVTFLPDGGDPAAGLSDAGGRFALTLQVGTAGQLQAARDHGPGDPGLTTASALEALRMAVGLNPSWGQAGAQDFIAADFDGDGRVSTADALGILRVAVGLPAEQAPRWILIDSAADLSGIGRSTTQVDPGLRLDAVGAQTAEPGFTGILVGHLTDVG